ncbi:hypothetical protein [Liquorilactobacillus uvarum]|uniref:PepSY domain-containing protein n=1 Tax=Liquorilactobacillus uvarum DSM 19971 TaxID=1423812 RepID=A0A0R1Q8B8_9LACO|nr:hypothetical protein [Liquorilactobacillus uvarum]KRL38597.1 hypothetical protein FD20_GL001313 [Liquorilactobacillus uvarum DSM 19971]
MTDLKSNNIPLMLGVLVGFATGIYANRLARKKTSVSPQKILEQVKKTFQEETPIQGAWINTFTQPFQKFAFKTQVYSGGISRIEDRQLIQYKFLADAKTGGVLDLQRL